MLLRITDDSIQPQVGVGDPSALRVEWFDPSKGSWGEGSLAEAAGVCQGKGVTVLAPARDVVLHQAQLPARNRQQLIKAAPYALEERFICDPELLHFAFPARLQRGFVEVAVVARERMSFWMAALAEAGIRPKAVAPESLALPLEENEWVLLTDGAQAIMRSGCFSALCVPRSEISTLLTMALEDSGAPPGRLRVYAIEGDVDLPQVTEWCHKQGLDSHIEHPPSVLAVMARGLNSAVSINLLQGDYSPAASHQGQATRAWKRVAILAALLVLLKAAITAHALHELRQQDYQLSGEIEQIYRDTFPDARNLVDPRFQMEQRLAVLRDSSGDGELPRLLATIAQHLKNTQGVALRELSYRPGGVELELHLPDFNSLDRLTARLASDAGLAAEVVSATTQQDAVNGRLRVAGGGT